MSTPTLSYNTPALTHTIRLGWLAIGAAVLALQPAFNLFWRWVGRPFVVRTTHGQGGLYYAVDVLPALVAVILILAGVALFSMVSRRLPPASGGRGKAFLLLAVAALYGMLNVAGAAITRFAFYRVNSGTYFPNFRAAVSAGNIASWLAQGLMVLLLAAAILFLLHAGRKGRSLPLAVVGASGTGLALLIFLCSFGLGTIYTVMSVINSPGGSFLSFYSNAMTALSIAFAVINILLWPAVALLAMLARSRT